MARMTAEERAQLEALSERAKAEESENEGLEIWVKGDDGPQVKLTGDRARKFLDRLGISDDDEQDAEEDAETDEPPAEAASMWRRGKGK
jgi:ribosome assembly protein YihI (activator of Der GTPase)